MQTASITSRISTAGLLALGILPVLALATPGHAAVVKISDLNLASAQGQAVYEQRAEHAAREFCSDERRISAKRACHVGVRQELSEKLAVLQTARSNFAAR